MTQTTFHSFFLGKVASLSNRYLKPSDVAETYNVSYRTVLAWIHLEVDPLEAYEVGGQYRIPESALNIFIKPANTRVRLASRRFTHPSQSSARRVGGRN